MNRYQVVEDISAKRLDKWHGQVLSPFITDEEFAAHCFLRRTKGENASEYDRQDTLFLVGERCLHILRAESLGFEDIDPGPRAKSHVLTLLAIPFREIQHVEMNLESGAFRTLPSKVERQGVIRFSHDIPALGGAGLSFPPADDGYQLKSLGGGEREVSITETEEQTWDFLRAVAQSI